MARGLGLDRAGFVDRLADDVHDAAERFVANRNHDRSAGVDDFLAADQTFGRIHGDGADGVFTQMLRHFENQAVAAKVQGFQRVQDLRQFVELHVDDGADDLYNLADIARAELGRCLWQLLAFAGAALAGAAFGAACLPPGRPWLSSGSLLSPSILTLPVLFNSVLRALPRPK
jgi:hypothetical protein